MKIKAKGFFERIWGRYTQINVPARASLWFVFCSIIQKGISIIALPIFTRLMSTEEFGNYNIYLTWFNILVIIVTLNLQSEIFNKGLIEHNKEKDAFTANQTGLLIFLGLTFTLLYLPFQDVLNELLGLSTIIFVIMLIDIVSNAIISLWSARKRFEFEYLKVVWVTIAVSILNPLIGILAVSLSQYKAEARVVSNAMTPFFFAVALVWAIKKNGKLFSNYHWWKISIVSSIPLIPHYLSLVVLNQSDKLMINYYSGASAAAIYSVAHSAGLLMTIINSSINSSFVPWAYNKIKNNDSVEIAKVANYLFGVVMVVNLLLIWLAPEAIKILAPPQYKDAIWCLVPIAISVYFSFLYTLFVDVEIYYGGNIFIAIASVGAAVLNVVLNYVFIPCYGYIVAGYTTLFSYFATMILHYLFMKRILKKSGNNCKIFNMKIAIAISLVLIVFSVIAMMLYEATFIRICFVGMTCFIAIIKKNKLITLFKSLKEI